MIEEMKLYAHYYLQDEDENNIHSMNAFIHQKCSYNILEIIRIFIDVLDQNIDIEAEALEEGGLEEIFKFCFSKLSLPEQKIVARIIVYVPVILATAWGVYKVQGEKFKAQNLKQQNIPQDIHTLIDKVVNHPKFLIYLSNLYENLNSENRSYQISFSIDNDPKTTVSINKSSYIDFILTKEIEEDISTFNDAIIEIVMPNLTIEKSYKWKGKFTGEYVDLRMQDKKFCAKVDNRDIVIEHGFHILCVLQKTQRIEISLGNINYKTPTYEVIEVKDFDNSLDGLLNKNNISKEEFLKNQPVKELSKLKNKGENNDDTPSLFD